MIDNLSQILIKAVQQLYGIDAEVELSAAPESTGADYATNLAMQLAKLVHKSPMIIAEELKAEIEKSNENSAKNLFELTVAQPGFLNFRIHDSALQVNVKEVAENGVMLERRDYDGKTVVCEFSDPNPFKVLHVGHLYTSIVGDSIARLLECAGAKVVRANFGGDVGLHVGKTLWALQNKDTVSKLEDLMIEQIAKAYVEGTRAYDEDEAAHREITKINAEVYDIALHDRHDSRLAELYWRGRELSYRYFKDFYARIGVHFDKYYPESTVASRGLEEVRIGFDRGVYDESDGAVVYRGEKLGLHTRVFINREGLPTYEAKDVGLIFTKWDDWRFDESVVITGNDIVDYMKVVLASVSEMAPQLSERTRHLTHGQVKLAGNEKMSSRKGNFLKAVDVLEMVETELAKVAENINPKIVLAAVKYAFLKYRLGGDIIFDPSESVAMTGNSGVYLLYAVVRAKKILQQPAGRARDDENGVGIDVTVDGEAENAVETSQKTDGDIGYASSIAQDDRNVNSYVRKLEIKVTRYAEALAEAIDEKSPSKLCTYLYELAQEFSRFYEHIKVSGSDNERELRELVAAYVQIMEHGLGLLGIEVPEEM